MARETLVLLPGMMCDARLFAPQIAAFEGQYEIYVGALNTASDISQIARLILDAVPARTFNICGLSMGGIVAMEIARLAPERLLRLALLDTNHLADTAERVDMRNVQIAKIEAGRLHDVVVEEMKPTYLAQQNRSDADLLNLLIDMAMDLGPEIFIAQSQALRDRSSQKETLQQVEVPTLVLCGEEDTLCPLSRHEEMSKLVKGSQFLVIPDAGHITTLENPPAVNAALANWLQSPKFDQT